MGEGDISYKKLFKFIWDEGNRDKNWEKHEVTNDEAEEVFYDPSKQEYPDPTHSQKELRKVVVGKTKKGRILFVVYTIRDETIRVISARDLNKEREVDLYEKAT